jgi:hypothetical protein
MSEFTKGPWHVYANTVTAGETKGNDVRAESDPWGRVCKDCSMEDARLIAAAPDLLAACEAVLILAGNVMSSEECNDNWAVKKARAAIAAAKGGTNAN